MAFSLLMESSKICIFENRNYRMAAVKETKKKYTEEEYLELERKAVLKSEYFKGEIFAMSGASLAHNKITMNFLGKLLIKLNAKTCQPYGSDLRLHIPSNSLYTYPDISVVCGKEQLLDKNFDTLLNPVFIAEILSPSTADYDTGGKFALYRSIESLKEYWAVSSFEYRLQKFVKDTSNNTWILSETINPNDSMTLESLGLTISMQELYEGVTF
jgi:Uma2 family endonuclease